MVQANGLHEVVRVFLRRRATCRLRSMKTAAAANTLFCNGKSRVPMSFPRSFLLVGVSLDRGMFETTPHQGFKCLQSGNQGPVGDDITQFGSFVRNGLICPGRRIAYAPLWMMPLTRDTNLGPRILVEKDQGWHDARGTPRRPRRCPDRMARHGQHIGLNRTKIHDFDAAHSGSV